MEERTNLSNQNQESGPRVNQEITAAKVRLVGEDGEMIGVIARGEALQMAADVGLDLVEISPNAEPPVCKIIDYGKFKYEAQKRKAEAKKKQKIVEIKEIKIRPMIDDNDFEFKMRSAQRFLTEGDKVKVTMRFRGREISHNEIGMAVLQRVQEKLSELAKVEQPPKFEGKQIIMLMGPL